MSNEISWILTLIKIKKIIAIYTANDDTKGYFWDGIHTNSCITGKFDYFQQNNVYRNWF